MHSFMETTNMHFHNHNYIKGDPIFNSIYGDASS